VGIEWFRLLIHVLTVGAAPDTRFGAGRSPCPGGGGRLAV